MQLAAMYKRAHDAGIRVVAGTIIPYNTATADQNARMHDINDWIRTQRRADPGVIFVDTRAAVARGQSRQAGELPRRPAPRRRRLSQDGRRHRPRHRARARRQPLIAATERISPDSQGAADHTEYTDQNFVFFDP